MSLAGINFYDALINELINNGNVLCFNFQFVFFIQKKCVICVRIRGLLPWRKWSFFFLQKRRMVYFIYICIIFRVMKFYIIISRTSISNFLIKFNVDNVLMIKIITITFCIKVFNFIFPNGPYSFIKVGPSSLIETHICARFNLYLVYD